MKYKSIRGGINFDVIKTKEGIKTDLNGKYEASDVRMREDHYENIKNKSKFCDLKNSYEITYYHINKKGDRVQYDGCGFYHSPEISNIKERPVDILKSKIYVDKTKDSVRVVFYATRKGKYVILIDKKEFEIEVFNRKRKNPNKKIDLEKRAQIRKKKETYEKNMKFLKIIENIQKTDLIK